MNIQKKGKDIYKTEKPQRTATSSPEFDQNPRLQGSKTIWLQHNWIIMERERYEPYVLWSWRRVWYNVPWNQDAHSTETCGYKNPQELSRLERKTLDLSTRMMKKIPTRKSIHTVIIKSASNINLGGVKRAHEESQLTWLHEQSSEEKQVVSLLCSL